MRPELSREETLARLLREELRTLEASYPEYGSRKTVAPQQKEDSAVEADAAASRNVDLMVPDETKNNRVSDYDAGRSLEGRMSSMPDVLHKRPQPPFYAGSEHLAEKPALPPHVLKARSGDLVRVRSRSRPVYKPLYSSSEHLAARPAIPLPQLEAYQNRKGSEDLAPYLDEEAKSGDLSTASPLPRTTTSQPVGLSTRTTTKVSPVHPTFPTRVKSPTKEAAVEASTQEVQLKPVFFHASQDEFLSSVTTLEPLTRGTRTTIVTSTSTTASPSSKVQASTTTPAPRTGLAFHSKPPVTRHVSVPTASPLVIQTSAPTSVVTRAPDVVDTPTNLYLPDPLVLSNQHSKPQFSRFTPGIVPSSRNTDGGTNPDRRTTRRFHNPTRSPPAFPPRRRMTFQPFKRTNRPTPTVSGTTPTPWRQPSKPSFYAGGDSELMKDLMPAVHPVPDRTLAETTPKSLLISTEPTVHLSDNFPEVPDEKDEEDREDRPETPASAVTKPASSQTVQTTAPTPASAVSEDSVTVASVPPTKQPEDTTQPSTPHQDPVVRTTVAHAETTATGVSPASEASQGPVPASDMMPSEDAGGATIELPSNSETKPLSTSEEPAEEPATSEGHDRDNMPSIPKREEATHVAPDVSQSTEGAPHDFESPMGESPPPVAEAEDHDGDAESEKATLNIDEALDDVQAEVPGLEPLEDAEEDGSVDHPQQGGPVVI
ncbi:mucin-5AC-like [Ixodes scapularis]|uniref:mucin-5AC-like n=1 Tax=Ixodes scapularis TaxID=6945 RepID=UPI001C38AF61|nr:mucin-5AC-like [Ixodes scapularis]